MIDFVGLSPIFENHIAVCHETIHFHIAHTNVCLRTTLFCMQGGLSEQFGPQEKLSLVGVHGKLNWMPG